MSPREDDRDDDEDESDEAEARPARAPRGQDELEAFTVATDEDGTALLELLSERLFDVASSSLRRLLKAGEVLVNDRPGSEDKLVHAGDRVAYAIPEDEVLRFEPEPLEGFAVLYEDARCLACRKPAGTAVIAERGETKAPFLGAVLHHLLAGSAAKGLERPPRPRVVHRIDKDTSGVVVLAKDRDALRFLSEQFQEREVAKEYLALVEGEIPEEQDSGEIDLPIGPALRSRDRRSRVGGRDGKEARTSWAVAERFRGYTLLRVHPLTGRQHQIRVHLEAVGYPLAVDPVYGGSEGLLLSKVKVGYRSKSGQDESPLLGRLSLHAHKVGFRSPAFAPDAPPVEVVAPLPHDFEVALKQLRKYAAPGARRAPRRRAGH